MADLFLFTLAGSLHAVSGNEILRSEEPGSLFRLPLHPPQIAGLALIGERTITLADLAACLGYPGQSRNNRGTALLLSEDDCEIGFFVADSVHRETIPLRNLFPTPESLTSPLISRCALIEGELIPLIDLTALRARLEEGNWEPPEINLKIPPQGSRSLEDCKGFRLLHLGGEPFAMPEADLRVISETDVKIGGFEVLKNRRNAVEGAFCDTIKSCPLGKTPSFLKGLCSTGGGLRPVVHLEPLLGLSPAPSSQLPLAGRAGKHEVIFFADHLQARSFAAQASLALPPLAQRRGMRHALMAEGRIIPLLDLAGLLEVGSASPPWFERYSTADAALQDPRPSFREFSLRGGRFAVPKAEMETVLPLLPMRSIPSDLPLLRGIAEHQGELWPVLDLAPYFGGHIEPDDCGGLLAVQNGDFRALVMAEEIFDEIRPDQESRRELPLALAQHLVYDCYLQANEVIVVLNVKAMALNFDPGQAKSCREAVKVKETEKDAEVAHSADATEEERKEEVSDPRPPEEQEVEGPAPASLDELPATEPAPVIIPVTEKEDVTSLQTQNAPPGGGSESAETVEGGPIPDEILFRVDPEPTATSAAPQEIGETAPLSAHEVLSVGNESRESFHGEAAAQSPPAPCDSTAQGEESTNAEREDLITDESFCPPAVFAPLRSCEEPTSIPAFQCGARPLPEVGDPPAAVQKPAVAAPAAPSLKVVPEGAADFRLPVPAEPVRNTETHPSRNDFKQPTTRRFSRAVAITTLLTALTAAAGSTLYFVDDRPEDVESQSVALEKKEAAARIIPEPTSFRGEVPIPVPASPAPADAAPTPEIISPPAAPTEAGPTTTYRVISGDTLWDIAQRSTGDPFFYRRIAGDNAILDPNLIHPGQELLLPCRVQDSTKEMR